MKLQEQDIKEMLDRYLNGTATAHEKDLLERFFMDHKHNVINEENNSLDYQFLQERIRDNIYKSSSLSRRKASPLFKIAASITVILLVGFAFFIARQQKATVYPPAPRTYLVKRTTAKGQKVTIKLPDGSVVKLNSGSSLSFPDRFIGGNREVSLVGEAYFNVVHNPASPFIVRTSNSSTQVLGTSFNVNDNSNGSTAVTLVSGKVKVRANDSEIQLKPSQQAIIKYNVNKIDTLSVDVAQFVEWKDNVLRFDDMPLLDAVRELEDWYGVTVKLEGTALENCRITGRYEAEPLKNVLESFQFMLKGRYSLNGKEVTLFARGCRNENQN